jgi:hypothetical protein
MRLCRHFAVGIYPPTRQSASLTRADALEREITDLCAHINAAIYRLLQLIAELDDTGPWGAWGLTSCAHWLNWRCGIGMNAARQKLIVVICTPADTAVLATGSLTLTAESRPAPGWLGGFWIVRCLCKIPACAGMTG